MYTFPSTEKTINGRVYREGFRIPFSQSPLVLKEKRRLVRELQREYGKRPLVRIYGKHEKHWVIKPIHKEPIIGKRIQKSFAEKLKKSGRIRGYTVRKFTQHKLTGSGYGYVLKALLKGKRTMKVI